MFGVQPEAAVSLPVVTLTDLLVADQRKILVLSPEIKQSTLFKQVLSQVSTRPGKLYLNQLSAT